MQPTKNDGRSHEGKGENGDALALEPATRRKATTVAVLLILALSILLLAATFRPLWTPLFLAAVLAAGTYSWFGALSRGLGQHPKLAATLMTTGLVLLVLIPTGLVAIVIVHEGIQAAHYVAAALKQGGIEELASRLPDRIEGPLRRAAQALSIDREALAKGGITLAGAAGDLLRAATKSAFNLAMMLVAYAGLLVSGTSLLRWFERVSPLPGSSTHELLLRFKKTAVSVLGSTIVSAASQAVVAGVGYAIADVPNPVFFAFLTGVAALIPAVGTPLVTLPLAGLMFVTGHTWQGIFLALYGVLVVSMIDNVIKPIVVRGSAQMNGTLVFFSMFGGILAFGPIGLIIGPLSVTFFQTTVEFIERAGRPAT